MNPILMQEGPHPNPPHFMGRESGRCPLLGLLPHAMGEVGRGLVREHGHREVSR
jgi:hypothetical protein